MNLIESTELDVAAVFPQCFDNQFVSFAEFVTISTEGGSYTEPRVAASRQKRTMMEMNRSLVYGQQVCVNRASFLNCKPLYELYLPDFIEDGSTRANPRYQIDEIGELLKKRALVPYLIRGTQLDSDFGFSVDIEGRRALEHLLEKHQSSISFMTMGPTPEQIAENAAKMQLAFEERIEHLARVAENATLYPIMLEEILPCVNLVADPSWLRDRIYELSDLASERARRRRRSKGTPLTLGTLSREDIYKEALVRECTCGSKEGLGSRDCICITNGRFARVNKSDVGTQFCVKALIDLVYAANIPDMLHRFVLTPWQLPTRNALQDYGPAELRHTASIDDVAVATFAASQRLLATAGQAMYLPMLEDLTLADICAIRELPAWHGFMAAQERLINAPLDGARSFSDFQDSFSLLQSALSTYWTTRRFEGPPGKLYRSFVSAAFQIGKFVLQWGIRKTGLASHMVFMLDTIITYITDKTEDRITVGPAKILFEIFDNETHKVDAARSWSIEWMHKQVAWDRDDLLRLLKEERERLKEETDTFSTPEIAIANVSGA